VPGILCYEFILNVFVMRFFNFHRTIFLDHFIKSYVRLCATYLFPSSLQESLKVLSDFK
jgi:hypothetical protein